MTARRIRSNPPATSSFPELTTGPLRSLLFTPGNSVDKLRKALHLGADCLILDLEDSVPEMDKSAARSRVRGILESAPSGSPFLLVRINCVSSPHGEKDLKAVVATGLAAIVLPKCHSSEVVVAADRMVNQEEKSSGLAPGSISFVLLIESAKALLEAAAMVQASRRVIALALGAEDYCLDMGIARTPSGAELAYPRAILAVTARAYGLLGIDAVFTDFKDTIGLIKDAQNAKAAGLSGKLAIHPTQIDSIHSVFSPQPTEIDAAKRILESVSAGNIDRVGAASLDGKMIDRPVIERSRRLLALHEQLMKKNSK